MELLGSQTPLCSLSSTGIVVCILDHCGFDCKTRACIPRSLFQATWPEIELSQAKDFSCSQETPRERSKDVSVLRRLDANCTIRVLVIWLLEPIDQAQSVQGCLRRRNSSRKHATLLQDSYHSRCEKQKSCFWMTTSCCIGQLRPGPYTVELHGRWASACYHVGWYGGFSTAATYWIHSARHGIKAVMNWVTGSIPGL
jgi:hypothetical protein